MARYFNCLSFATAFFMSLHAGSSSALETHARSLYDQPFYKQDFQHFNYVNPEAPRDGMVRLAVLGSFDTFNIFSSKGIPATVGGFLYDSLMVRSKDEPTSIYPLIASSIEYPEDNSWVKFRINPKARFSDGTSITADDIAYTFQQYRSSDLSSYQHKLVGIEKVSVVKGDSVRFDFNNDSTRELPFSIATLPILPRHYWQDLNLNSADLDIPVSSGPYVIKKFDAGKTIWLERLPDYWAEKLPVNVGRHNFKSIKQVYYRNSTVSLQAFLANEYDLRVENLAKNWQFGYEGSELDSGRIIKLNHPRKTFQVQAFVFNTRREKFSQREVREAISQGYDGSWINKNLLYDGYKQPESLFALSDYGQRGLPSEAEVALLAPFRSQLPESLFKEPWHGMISNGSGNIRKALSKAERLLNKAGWMKSGRQRLNKTGKSLDFELLLAVPEQERVAIPFQRNLQQLGINMRITAVDISQYVQRVREKDYDMLLRSLVHPAIPGLEQKEYWHSSNADSHGSHNLAGVKSSAVDAVLDNLSKAENYQQLVIALRALDRVLLWEYFTIPQLYAPYWRVAYRKQFNHPKIRALYGSVDFSLWWQRTQ